MIQYNINIDSNEVLRYLGYGTLNSKAPPDPGIMSQIADCSEEVREAAAPLCTYRILDIEKHENEIRLKNSSLILTGKTANEMLSDCSSCVVLAATLGRSVDRLLRRRQIKDMSSAVIIDSCANSGIESVCEQITEDLRTSFGRQNKYITDRFSPGYGDLPLELQPDIIRTLSADRAIGLTVSGSLLLIPSKSVTAFIGISDRPQPALITGCRNCSMKDRCRFRKAGTTCVSK